MEHYTFTTEGFRDSPTAFAEGMNCIEGHNLAQALQKNLTRERIVCDEFISEDFGWIFVAKDQGENYLIAISLDGPDGCVVDDEYNEVQAPVGTQMDGNLSINKQRSIVEKILRRNQYDSKNNVSKAILKFISGHPEIIDPKAE